jgi:CRISPR-associated protein Csm5
LIKLYDHILTIGKGEQYEKFLLQRSNIDLQRWLRDNGIDPSSVPSLYSFDLPEIETAKPDKRSGNAPEPRLNEISSAIKDPYKKPYVPGSSLKGAIRTMLLIWGIRSSLTQGNMTDSKARSILEANKREIKQNSSKPRELKKIAKDIEEQMLGLLENGKTSATRDFMSALSISDSHPLALTDLTICQKIDALPNGIIWGLPTFRECIKPGVKIVFDVTIDTSKLKDKKFFDTVAAADVFDLAMYRRKDGTEYKARRISQAITTYNHLYWSLYRQVYENELSKNVESISIKNPGIFIGAGTGMLTKTMLLSLLGEENELADHLSSFLDKKFKKHYHSTDREYHGVSPRVLKLTKYGGKYYEMGRCVMAIEDVK